MFHVQNSRDLESQRYNVHKMLEIFQTDKNDIKVIYDLKLLGARSFFSEKKVSWDTQKMFRAYSRKSTADEKVLSGV